MNVAIVSPLTRNTAIAKYSVHLAQAIGQIAKVTVYYDPLESDEGFRLPHESFARVPADEKGVQRLLQADVVHFQMGNYYVHHFANHVIPEIRRAGLPVIVTLHDGMLNGAFRRTCVKCWAFAAGNIRYIPETLIRSFKGIIQDKKVLRHLPPAGLCTEVWPNLADRVIFHSRASRTVSKYRLNDERVVFLPMLAVDGEPQKPPSGVPIIFAPGLMLSRNRGLNLVMEGLGQAGINFRLVIGGTESDFWPGVAAELRECATRLGIEDKVEFSGYLDEDEFIAMVARSRVVAIPRVTTTGEVSYALIHALSAGRPVVASDVGTFPDYLQDGITGFLVPHDPSAWADAMRTLLTDSALWHQMQAAALCFVDDRLRPDKVARQHLDIYKELRAASDSRH